MLFVDILRQSLYHNLIRSQVSSCALLNLNLRSFHAAKLEPKHTFVLLARGILLGDREPLPRSRLLFLLVLLWRPLRRAGGVSDRDLDGGERDGDRESWRRRRCAGGGERELSDRGGDRDRDWRCSRDGERDAIAGE